MNEAGQRIVQALGRMSIRELYKLINASVIVLQRIPARYSYDKAMVDGLAKFTMKEQAQTLVMARRLAQFVQEHIGDLKLADLIEQDEPATESPDAQEGNA